jgi:ATP-binding cassette subfamily G (WHITE) protein 2 (PDR)
MVNEFSGRDFPCAYFVPSGPSYEDIAADQRACAVQGSVPGAGAVSGTAFVQSAFGYQHANRWRNFGIIVVLTAVLLVCHLVTTELVASARSKGEVLVFRRSKMQKAKEKQLRTDEETGSTPATIVEKPSDSEGSNFKVEQQASVFHWEDVCYEVQIKGQPRKILDSVDGWIKPGTLTALMVSC